MNVCCQEILLLLYSRHIIIFFFFFFFVLYCLSGVPGVFFHASMTFSTWMLSALLLPLCACEPALKPASKGVGGQGPARGPH